MPKDLTLTEFHDASNEVRITAFVAAYDRLSQLDRAYIDEAVCNIVDKMKSAGCIRFSQKQALELLGTIALYMQAKNWEEWIYVSRKR